MARQLAEVGGQYPSLAELAQYMAECDYGEEFEFGLDVTLAGLDVTLAGLEAKLAAARA